MRNLDSFVGLFFGPLPNLEELVAVKARIQTEQNDTSSTIQPLCCRELIFTEPKILVSPIPEERNQLFIVAQKAIFDSSQLQKLLEKLNIQSTQPIELTKNLFQYCFSFTLRQRIAPLWNKAGEFLVQGRDFLEEQTKLNAVTLELTITDKICIGLHAYALKSPPSKPEHFSASCRALEEFHTNPSAVITESSLSDDLCFVLPSLKKGRILSISHQLPEDSPFQSYEDLRKHWKLTYGYRLPVEENVFYDVRFYYIREKIFTYPASCIRSAEVTVSPRCDHQSIFNAFLKDLSSRLPSVCGTPLVLTTSPLYPTSRLQQATRAAQSNLTRTAPQWSHCRPFTSVANQGGLSLNPQNRFACSTPSLTSFSVSSPSLTSFPVSSQAYSQSDSLGGNNRVVNQVKTTPTETPSLISSGERFVPCFTSRRVIASDVGGTGSQCNIPRPTLGPRIVPVFKRPNKETEGNSSSSVQKMPVSKVPMFGQNVRKTTVSAPAFSLSQSRLVEQETTERAANQERVFSQDRYEMSPAAFRVHSTTSQVMSLGINQSHQDPGLNTATPESPHRVLTETVTQNNNPQTARNVPSFAHITKRLPQTTSSAHVSKRLPQTRPGLMLTQALDSTVGRVSDQYNSKRTSVGPSLHQDERAKERPAASQGIRDAVDFPGQTGFSGEITRKRQVHSASNEDSLHKKSKSKPKIQDGIDVQELAISDQLNKVNAVTLIDWLKKKGVSVKSKDKKAELANKVKQYLALNLHEP